MKTAADFASKKEYVAYLIKNKGSIITEKKSAVKFADPFGTNPLQQKANKALNTSHKDDVASGQIKRTIIGNTYYWMDSHDDVHVGNCFEKSISDRKDKIWHLHDHEQKITSKVGKPESIYEKVVDWADLGVNKAGQTTALFMDTEIIKEWNPLVFGEYLSGEINQHSVGMYYVNLALAVNDQAEKEEFAVWNKYIDRIGNKEKVIEQGYFWAVEEATLVEISCVLAGSNELTPTVENRSKEKEKQAEPVKTECNFYERLAKTFSQ